MKAGEIQRWRFVNATGQLKANAFRIGFSDDPEVVPEIYLIAVDGVYISNDEWETEESDGSVFLVCKLVVTKVRFRRRKRVVLLRLAAQTHNNEKANATRTPTRQQRRRGATPFLTVQVEGALAQPMSLPTAMPEPPPQLVSHSQQRNQPPTYPDFLFVLEGQQGGAGQGQAPVFAIDGQLFDPCRVDQCLTAGTAEEWTVINSTSVAHPFHIHVNPFFIMVTTIPPSVHQRAHLDSTPTPPTAGKSGRTIRRRRLRPRTGNGFVTFRYRFPTDTAGKFVLHCHILGHEVLGYDASCRNRPSGETVPPAPE